MGEEKILIVEDNVIEAMDIKRTVESFGYSVPYVARGEEAATKALKIKPDLILMDVTLKEEIDGIEAISKIKELNIPFIYLTAHSEESIERAKITESSGYIIKPFDSIELKYAIELALYKSSQGKKIKESDAIFRSLYENSFDAILLTKPDGSILSANQTAQKMFGRSEKEIIKVGKAGLVVENEHLKEILKQRRKKGKIKAVLRFKRKDGSTFLGEGTSSFFTDADGITKTSMIIRDVTEREKAENELNLLNRKLLALSKCNQTLLRAVNEQTLLNEICRIICDEAGYRLAWVGYAEHDADKTIRPVAWAGYDSSYIAKANLSWSEDTTQGQGPAGIVIRSGELIYVQDFVNDPLMAPWRESALKSGYRSGIALPLKDKKAQTFGVLLIYSAEPNTINPDEIWLMEELASNLEFGITSLREQREKKHIEEELMSAGLYNRSLIEASLDPLFTIGADGKITDVNKATEKVTGFPRDELISTDFSDYFTEPDKAKEGYQKVFKEGLVRDYPLEIQHQNGHVTPVLYNASLYRDKSGNAVGVFAAARDITDRLKIENALKESEIKYKSLFESNPDYTILSGLDGITLDVNVAAEKVIGFPKEELIGKHFSELKFFPKDEINLHGEKFSNLLKHENVAPYESRIFDLNSNLRWVITSLTLILEDNTPKYILIINSDITERKKNENQIIKSLEEKEVLLREIHHRVKNNMQIISSLLNLQIQYVENSEAENILKESQGRVKSMAMVHEKLYQSPHFNNINFKEYLKKLVSDIFYSYGIKTGTIEYVLNIENINIAVETAIPLGLIINELVTNSLKYAFPKCEGTIKIELKQSKEGLELIVADNGIGLPKKINIYNTPTLGLQLVNNLVNQIDGQIELDRNNGTSFKINFKASIYKDRLNLIQ